MTTCFETNKCMCIGETYKQQLEGTTFSVTNYLQALDLCLGKSVFLILGVSLSQFSGALFLILIFIVCLLPDWSKGGLYIKDSLKKSRNHSEKWGRSATKISYKLLKLSDKFGSGFLTKKG